MGSCGVGPDPVGPESLEEIRTHRGKTQEEDGHLQTKEETQDETNPANTFLLDVQPPEL